MRYSRLTAFCACAVALISSLAGCATRPQPLYYWGTYEAQVYAHFKGDKSPEDQILALEKEREAARSLGRSLPPGFHAHLAMLYGKTGRPERLVENLEAEKAQYPEGAAFVDFLLRNVKRR